MLNSRLLWTRIKILHLSYKFNHHLFLVLHHVAKHVGGKQLLIEKVMRRFVCAFFRFIGNDASQKQKAAMRDCVGGTKFVKLCGFQLERESATCAFDAFHFAFAKQKRTPI